MKRLLLLLLLAAPAYADEAFWVLGSYPDEEIALSEGRRISSETGIEILKQDIEVEGTPYYRLLTAISSEESDQADLRFQLEQAGVDDVWTLLIEGDRPIMQTIFADVDDLFDEAELAELDEFIADFDENFDDSYTDDLLLEDMDQPSVMGAFVVAGSFTGYDTATNLASRLEPVMSYGVTIKDAEVNGVLYHRVLVGPILQSEEADALASLAAQGVTSGWVLRNVEVSASLLKSSDVTPVAPVEVPEITSALSREMTQPVEYGPDDYNLAKLKKKSTGFPADPRKKKD